MRIFICHSSHDTRLAKELAGKLGRHTFHFSDELHEGTAWRKRVASTLKRCRMLIYLETPWSVGEDSVCWADLDVAQGLWGTPERRVVRVQPTKPEPGSTVHGFVEVLEPIAPGDGMLPRLLTEVRRRDGSGKRRAALGALVVLPLLLLALGAVLYTARPRIGIAEVGQAGEGERVQLTASIDSWLGLGGEPAWSEPDGQDLLEAPTGDTVELLLPDRREGYEVAVTAKARFWVFESSHTRRFAVAADDDAPALRVEGADGEAEEGDELVLDAGASRDPEGEELDFRWDGVPGRPDGVAGERLALALPEGREPYELQLALTARERTAGGARDYAGADLEARRETVVVRVHADDDPPVPRVELSAARLSEGGSIELTAHADDPDSPDDQLSYRWRAPAPLTLEDADQRVARLSAGTGRKSDYEAQVELTVTDAAGAEHAARQRVPVRAFNHPPELGEVELVECTERDTVRFGLGERGAAGRGLRLSVPFADPEGDACEVLRWTCTSHPELVLDQDDEPLFRAPGVDGRYAEDFRFEVVAWDGAAPAKTSFVVRVRNRVLHVDDDAPAGGTGAGWDDALGDLQDALDRVARGEADEIWVAGGTYSPTRRAGLLDDARDVAFELPPAVRVVGGFAGDEQAVDERAAVALAAGRNATVLSGRLGGGRSAFRIASSQSCRDLFLADLTFTGAYADPSEPSPYAGALNVLGGRVRIERCRFLDNVGTLGGALSLNSCYAELVDCELRGNRAPEGGGLRAASGLEPGAGVRLERCHFVANVATGEERRGGGAALFDGDAEVTACTFVENRSSASGGAVAVAEQRRALFAFCQWSGNEAASSGGALHAAAGTDVFRCSFWSNTAVLAGSAVALDAAAAPVTGPGLVVNGSIFWSADDALAPYVDVLGGGGPDEGLVEVHRTRLSPDSPWADAGEGNVFSDPRFEPVASPADRLMLSAESPCVDLGTDHRFAIEAHAVRVDGLRSDLAGNERHHGAAEDLGAFERVP
ncbi:MAG: hypothetical protein AAF682_12965 [Planctomycetota bacterium]